MSIILEFALVPDSAATVEFTDRVNLDGRNVSLTHNAEEVTVGSSTIVVDDGSGDWGGIVGNRLVRVEETEADWPITWIGYVTIREVGRKVYRTGAQRQWTLTLDDLNTIYSRALLVLPTANRPAETDLERMQYLFDENFIGEETYFNLSGGAGVAMDAVDLRGMTVDDTIRDCMLQSGRNAFALMVQLSGDDFELATFYDFAASDVYTSDLRISNYEADITAEVGEESPFGPAQTWAASQDTNMKRDPTRVYSRVRGQYDGGSVVRDRGATALEFGIRSTTASWPLVKSLAKATARADRYLLEISSEEDIITTTIAVHAEHVNDALWGHRIEARFSHLPLYEEWTWMRILNRTVVLVTPDVYLITYTLSPGSRAIPAGTCTTALGGADAWDSGEAHNVFDGPPIIFTPTLTDGIVIAIFAGANQTEPVWRGTQTASVTGYTQIGDSRTGWIGDAASIALVGYAPGGGAMTATWTGGGTSSGAQSWRAVAMSFLTAETSPVQFGEDITGSGGGVVLGAPPTDGNVLILAAYTENGGGFTLPAGWSLIVGGQFITNVNTGWCGIYARCAGPGESATVPGVNSSFSHWQFLSEWAIT